MDLTIIPENFKIAGQIYSKEEYFKILEVIDITSCAIRLKALK